MIRESAHLRGMSKADQLLALVAFVAWCSSSQGNLIKQVLYRASLRPYNMSIASKLD